MSILPYNHAKLFITCSVGLSCLFGLYKAFTYKPPSTHITPSESKPWWLNNAEEETSLSVKTQGVVDLDAFDDNCKKVIDQVIEINRCQNRMDKMTKKKIRIATKSIRCVALIKRFIRLILERDADIFAGLLCFSAKEMLQLVEHEVEEMKNQKTTSSSSSSSLSSLSSIFKHLLLAYSVIDAESLECLVKAKRLSLAASLNIEVATVVDSIEQVVKLMSFRLSDSSSSTTRQKQQQMNNNISESSTETEIKLWIDLDMSWKPFGESFPVFDLFHFGARRSPLDSPEKVKKLVDMIAMLDLRNNNNENLNKKEESFSSSQINSAQPVRLTLEGVQAYESQIAGFPDVVVNSPIPYFVRKFLKDRCTSSSSIRSRRSEVMKTLMKSRREKNSPHRNSKKSSSKIDDVDDSDFVAVDDFDHCASDHDEDDVGKNKEDTSSSSNKNKNRKNKSNNGGGGGVTILECNGGGSGSVAFSLNDPAVTEITVGSAALCGHQFDGYTDEPTYSPSLFFTLVVTRRPTKNIVTCHGGGWIASGDPGWNRLPKIVWPPGAKFLGFEGAGEVQTPIDVRGCSERVKAELNTAASMNGELAFVFRPNKSGEMGEVFSEYVLVSKRNNNNDNRNDQNDDDDKKMGVVKTYRGDCIHSWA